VQEIINSSEVSTEFTVLESSKFTIDKVFNYPNPFTTSTGFQFEHNRPGDDLQAMVQIFTVSGKLVKTINKDIYLSGSRVTDILWDAKDEYGDKLARGVYIYRLKVKASDGSISDKYEKLVILK
jgi:flagellar hook assembly protein FlgD